MKDKNVYIYEKNNTIEELKTKEGKILGDVLDTEDYPYEITEELYTGVYTLSFYYPIGGENSTEIKLDNIIKTYSYGQVVKGDEYFIIKEIEIDIDEMLYIIEADQYTVKYMNDPYITKSGKIPDTVEGVVNSVKNTPYINKELKLVYNKDFETGLIKKEKDYFGRISGYEDATLGEFLVGSSSFLNRYANVHIRRYGNTIALYNNVDLGSEDLKVEDIQIVLGSNMEDVEYEETSRDKYGYAMVEEKSIPIDLEFNGVYGNFGVYNGFGGTKFKNIEDIPVNTEMIGIYKGLPIKITKTTNNRLEGYKASIFKDIKKEEGEKVFEGWNLGITVDRYERSNIKEEVRLKLTVKGNDYDIVEEKGTVTILNEIIEEGNLKLFYMAEGGIDKTVEYLGGEKYYPERDMTEEEEDEIDPDKETPPEKEDDGTVKRKIIKSTKIEKVHLKERVKNPQYEMYMGNSTYYTSYKGEKSGNKMRGIEYYFIWLFYKFPKFWEYGEGKNLNRLSYEMKIDLLESEHAFQKINTEKDLQLGAVYHIHMREVFDSVREAEVVGIVRRPLVEKVTKVTFGTKPLEELDEVRITKFSRYGR